MGRRRNLRNRNKNKSRNRNNNNNAVAKTETSPTSTRTMEFLKRDSNIGLFMDKDGNKFRVHKKHILATLGWIAKGASISVKTDYAIPVENKRLFVQNCPDWFMDEVDEVEDNPGESTYVDASKMTQSLINNGQVQPSNKPYMFESDIQVVDSDFESINMGLPIGVQYHWISFTECPKKGDFVMGSRTGNSKGVMGYVDAVDDFMETCVIAGGEYSIMDIGYRIMNPMYIQGFVEFAN